MAKSAGKDERHLVRMPEFCVKDADVYMGRIKICICRLPKSIAMMVQELSRGQSIQRKTTKQIVTLHPDDLRKVLATIIRGDFTEASIWQISTDIKDVK